MMKIKFNKFERIAGLFVISAVVGGIFVAAGVAVKQGWLDAKVKYVTQFENAEGVHPGTLVQIAGLRAGSVEEVELQNDNRIRVTFYVLSKFSHRIKEDSVAQLVRPFIIGDRVLDVGVGSNESPLLQAGTFMPSQESIDMMSLLSGKKMGPYLEMMSGMMENLKMLAEAFLNKDRAQSMVNIFDKIDPLLKNMNYMSLEMVKLSKQATKDENLEKVLANVNTTTSELNAMLPVIREQAPQYAQNITVLIQNLNLLTKEFKVLIPALAEVGPELPRASRRAVEALDEAVVILKAMQKSMFLEGSVSDVREEERIRDARRVPATAGESTKEVPAEAVPTPLKDNYQDPMQSPADD
jgi:phospholipid/cholesterol/gamma-HCH transport system substrate-binding protein